MNATAMIRPAWTPATIALMIIGFMVFWPLGLAMLAYIIWGDRLDGFKRDVNRATDGIFAGCRRGADRAQRWSNGNSAYGRTGNAAFDDWREKELERLAEERRKLIQESPVAGQYDETIDRESAFEVLQKKAVEAQAAQDKAQGGGTGWTIPGFGDGGGTAPRRSSNRQTVAEAAIKSVVRSVGSSVGRAIVRGILGSLSRGR